jgi:hypothetical protein
VTYAVLLATFEALLQKIGEIPSGKEVGLVITFGDDWDEIGSSGQKKEFGRLFKSAVSKGDYPDIQWVRIENSGRYDVYRKL